MDWKDEIMKMNIPQTGLFKKIEIENKRKQKTTKMTEARFKKQIEGTKFQEDLGNMFRVNEGQMSRAVWNLIISKRDVGMFCNGRGMKPHRNWRLKDVKWYFGIAGGKEKVLEQLEQYLEIVTPKKENNEQ